MTSPFRGRALAAGALVLPALALAACGSSSKSTSDTTASGAQTASTAASTPPPATGAAGGAALKISADPSGQLKFDKASLTAKAGNVTIAMANPSSVPHSIAVEGNGVDKASTVKQAGQGQTATVSVKLKPGKYEFYCPVDGHKQAGMKGTLTVS